MTFLDLLLNALLFLLPLAHILVAPYTKVEESFNLQATHDILVYGTPTSSVRARFLHTYDHFTFPGVVPRTFVGPVLLAGVSQPLVAIAGFRHAQLVVRAVLALANAAALLVFRNAAASAFGPAAARWWVLLSVSQFHLVYYLGRTLPNMFAFGLATLAMAFLLPKKSPRATTIRTRQALGLLTLAGVVFRSELALLLLATASHLFLRRRQISLRSLVTTGLVSFLGALAISVPIDSYFWQQRSPPFFFWPELSAFYFNAVQGQASGWGTSPWHWYLSSALPRLLLNPLALPLVALSCLHPALARQTRAFLLPAAAYVALYSLQPHKETRFIFYVVPPFTLAAALSASYLASRAAKSLFYRACSLVLAASVVGTLAVSTAMLLLSSLNYPGGDALSQLYAHVARNHTTITALTTTNTTAGSSGDDDKVAPVSVPVIRVHADVLACMTGLTLFNQNPHGLPLALGGLWDGTTPPSTTTANNPSPIYLFDRTEKSEKLGWPSFWQAFDYALLEDPALALGEWDVVGVVHGYSGIEVLRPGQPDPSSANSPHKILGLAARIARARRLVRSYTGGWWVGPRMSPRVHIMKQKTLIQ